MENLLTPRQVARAMKVSESSIKRWCDKGVIETQYTAGGHRRITISGLLEFVRSGKRRLVHPEALNLPATTGQTAPVIGRARKEFVETLIAGDGARSRQIAIDLFLAEHAMSAICDDVFAAAFEEIGRRWSQGCAEVYQERRGCEVMLRVLHDLRKLLPAPPQDAPLAIGGTPAGDQYSLGTAMVELVLHDGKWNAISLGDNLPFETLAAAIGAHRPRLFWLSCSHITDEATFLRDYGQLYDQFGMDVPFVVGGSALTDKIRKQMRFSSYCENMQRLESFGQALHGALSSDT